MVGKWTWIRKPVFRKLKFLRALTSLDVDEFPRLLAAFEQEVQARRGSSTALIKSVNGHQEPPATRACRPRPRLCSFLCFSALSIIRCKKSWACSLS